MATRQPAEATTYEDFISRGNNIEEKYELFNFYNRSDIEGLTRPVYNILHDYKKEIMDYVVEVKLTDEQIDKYMYNPKKLAYDYYNRTDLYFFILFINDMSNVKEFSLDNGKIKMIRYNDLVRLLSDIIASEGKLLKIYNKIYS